MKRTIMIALALAFSVTASAEVTLGTVVKDHQGNDIRVSKNDDFLKHVKKTRTDCEVAGKKLCPDWGGPNMTLDSGANTGKDYSDLVDAQRVAYNAAKTAKDWEACKRLAFRTWIEGWAQNRIAQAAKNKIFTQGKLKSLSAESGQVDGSVSIDRSQIETALSEAEVADGNKKKGQAMQSDEIASYAGKNVENLTKASIGGLSREISTSMKHLTKFLIEKRISLLCLNQMRTKIGFITTEHTPGGNALHHYANTRIELRRTKLIKKTAKVQTGEVAFGAADFGSAVEATAIGAEVVATVPKNKRGLPFTKANLVLTFGRGFDIAKDMYEEMTLGGLANRQDRIYAFEDGDFKMEFTDLNSFREQLHTTVDPVDLRGRMISRLASLKEATKEEIPEHTEDAAPRKNRRARKSAKPAEG